MRSEMVGVASRRGETVPATAAATGWADGQDHNGSGPSGPFPTPRRTRRARKALLGLAAAALAAAAFAMVVGALQPERRPPLVRPTTSGVASPTVTVGPNAPGVPSAPGVTATPLDPGAVGRSIDQRLAVTRQIERVGFVVRWLGMTGAVVLMGMAVFLLIVFPNGSNAEASSPFEGQGRLRGLTVLLVLLTIVGELAELPVRAAVEGNRGWSGALDPGNLMYVAVSPVTVSCLLRVAGAVLILGMLVGRFSTVKRPFSVVRGGLAVVGGIHISGMTTRRAAMALGIAVTLASFAVIGHAQASEPRALLIIAEITHVAAAAVWLGGVVMLSVMLRRLRRIRKAAPLQSPDPGLHQARREMAVVVGRFSVAASLSVTGVTVAGVALAISQLGTVEALFRSPYGVTLVSKIIMVGFVVLLGGYNHRFLVPRVIENAADERAWRQMRQAVQIESVVILFGVLVATVALSSGGFATLMR